MKASKIKNRFEKTVLTCQVLIQQKCRLFQSRLVKFDHDYIDQIIDHLTCFVVLAIPIEVELVDVSGAVRAEVDDDFVAFSPDAGVVPGVEDARFTVSLAPVTTATGVERATGTTSPFTDLIMTWRKQIPPDSGLETESTQTSYRLRLYPDCLIRRPFGGNLLELWTKEGLGCTN